jgi:hypothetical protein
LPQLSATDETATVDEFHHTYKASRSPCCGWPFHPCATVVAALVLALALPRTKNPPAAGVDNGATVKVTVILAGEPWAPADVTVTWPVYVPAVSVPTVAETCKVWGAVPLAGVTVSQDESLATVKLSVPVPVFVTFAVCDVGFAPPCVALNVRVTGETDKTGCGGGGDATTKVTVTVAGEFCAPEDVTVTCPV